MHPEYNRTARHNYDIVLLKLEFRIPFDRENKVAPICIIASQNHFVGSTAIATGWGYTQPGKFIFQNSLSFFFIFLTGVMILCLLISELVILDIYF